MKCRECQYARISHFQLKNKMTESASCGLTNIVIHADAERDCRYFNADLSQRDICYNCQFYMGGGDWGLFCSHKDMYHHLGKFNDEPCKYYQKKIHASQSIQL